MRTFFKVTFVKSIIGNMPGETTLEQLQADVELFGKIESIERVERKAIIVDMSKVTETHYDFA